MFLLHMLSPILYMVFVKKIELIPTCPTSIVMKNCRKLHNIVLSIMSFVMLMVLFYSTYKSNKLGSVEDFICKPYSNDTLTQTNVNIFLYSKYLEWGDTVFLHLSGKQITMLQYTHHMTTAFLTGLNNAEYITPGIIIPMGLNCLVHIPMYWYFAYPKGVLQQFRKQITQIQIIQHVLVLSSLIYGSYYYFKPTERYYFCEQNKYGLQAGLLLYIMYLTYFSLFYISNYKNNIKKLK